MFKRWQLQDAKNRLSEVIESARKKGPQIITRRGVEAAVVLSFEEYRRLTLRQKPIVAFFRSSPLVGADLDLERDNSSWRDDISL